MTMVLTVTIGMLLLLAAIGAVVFWPAPPAPPRPEERRRPLKVHRLVDRLLPGDRVTVLEKSGRPRAGKHLPRETTFVELDDQGRMVLRTTPLSRPFRRPQGDLVRLAKGGAP